ncbi:hypothetical protein SISSUDRAFT_526767 [Sistotremastrum suecicum HHB10207 ss-3]|uniref:Fatty acid desaturase domain-containing protein n=1 Tax=Sistotremastrum suecicum HHB10207 ss-3 TaxID=1314776 RepID=A0A165XVZ0_9AGAM|nr:hypothetical protein SISSUDRAFT_526767 [Sistotremastrum suecicum HHB10207 ss-3]
MSSTKPLPKFTPMPWSMAELRAVIPSECFERNVGKSLVYLARHVIVSGIALYIMLSLDDILSRQSDMQHISYPAINVLRWSSWAFYWWFQSLMFVGFWAFAHECTHNAFSPNGRIDDVIGFTLFTFLGTPYFSWQMSHVHHHRHRGHAEKDVAYVPTTRSDLNIPKHDEEMDYSEYFEDTPLFTFGQLILRQLLGYTAFLVDIRTTSPKTKSLICHFLPSSSMFKHRYMDVVVSDLGLFVMGCLLLYATHLYGLAFVLKTYGIPWIGLNHWVVLITYLHHTAPNVPYYRGNTWNFQRGALSTVDRNPLGRAGRFFFLDSAHYHVVHHLFPQIPFYHLEEATKHLKALIGDYYLYSDEPVFQALWRSFTECQFVEDDGEVLFYRNSKGESIVEVE